MLTIIFTGNTAVTSETEQIDKKIIVYLRTKSPSLSLFVPLADTAYFSPNWLFCFF